MSSITEVKAKLQQDLIGKEKHIKEMESLIQSMRYPNQFQTDLVSARHRRERLLKDLEDVTSGYQRDIAHAEEQIRVTESRIALVPTYKEGDYRAKLRELQYDVEKSKEQLVLLKKKEGEDNEAEQIRKAVEDNQKALSDLQKKQAYLKRCQQYIIDNIGSGASRIPEIGTKSQLFDNVKKRDKSSYTEADLALLPRDEVIFLAHDHYNDALVMKNGPYEVDTNCDQDEDCTWDPSDNRCSCGNRRICWEADRRYVVEDITLDSTRPTGYPIPY